MFDAISRLIFGQSRLQWILPKFAGALKDSYGGSGAYTAGQVRRVLDRINAPADLRPLLFAAGCSEEEFIRAYPESTAEDYQARRQEIIDILELPLGTFSLKNYMPKHRIPVGPMEGGEGA